MVNGQTTWLITGGCGFIGKRLVRTIRAKYPKAGIRVFDNLTAGTKAELEKQDKVVEVPNPSAAPQVGTTELCVADITDASALKNAAQGCQTVIHLAANTGVVPSINNPHADCEANVLGTLNTLEAARINQCTRLIFASSGAPVGECPPPVHENLPCRPASPYGASKLAGEGYCSAYYHSFNLETICLRFSNVYGPGSTHKSSVVAKFLAKILGGEPIEVYGDGNQTRDFIHVDDLIAAIILACEIPRCNERILQISTGQETSINQLVELLRDLTGELGYQVSRQASGKLAGEVMRNFAAPTLAQETIGWKAAIQLKQGLRDLVHNQVNEVR